MRKLFIPTMLALSCLIVSAPLADAQQARKIGVASAQAKAMVTHESAPIEDATPRSNGMRSTCNITIVNEAYSPAPAYNMSSQALIPTTSLQEQIRQATGGTTMVGNVLFSDPPTGQTSGNARLGIFEFTTDAKYWNQLVANAPACNASVMVNDVYYNFYAEQGTILTYYYVKTFSTKTWKELAKTTITNAKLPRALTTDGTTVYGCFWNGKSGDASGYEYGVLNLSNFTHTVICALPRNWNACAWGNDGFIYAIDMGGDLQKVNPATGEMTLVGATGKVPKYISGGCIDKKTGKMYWTLSPEDLKGYLCEVNLQTGSATVLLQFPYNEEIGGVYVPFLAYDKAPAAVTDLSATFENGSLTGKVKFKCPATLFDGTAATGALTYSILANGTEVKTGTCAYGQEMDVDVTIASSNNYTLAVVVKNDAGDSPKTEIDLFIGKDKPKSPEATLSYSDGKMHLSWTKVTESVNGGYMDASKMKYTVYRYPDFKAVAKNIVETSFEEEIAIPDTYTVYYYSVMATCDGQSSAITYSNNIGLGTMKVPYTETFESIDALDNYTIIDSNDDGKKWAYYATEKCARMAYSLTLAMNDWLITPPIYLEAGKAYCFKSDFKNYDATKYPEIAEVKLGRAPTAEAMTTTLVEPTTFTGKTWTTVGSYIVPEETGAYYVGIHAISAKNSMYLYADNINVAEVDGGVPGPATGVEVVADAAGGLNAVIKGKAPATCLNGSALNSISKLEIKRNGVSVYTDTSIAPGADFSFTDNLTATGDYKWTVSCSNDKGEGKPVEVSTYVGIDVPSPVTNVAMKETSLGKVNITWTAPTTDATGKPLGSNPVTFKVTKGTTVLAQNLTEPSFDYQAVAATSQNFFQPIVYAMNSTGDSKGVYGPFYALGTPFKLPYIESFKGGDAPQSLLGVYKVNGNAPDWGLCYDNYMGIPSADNDNGYMSCKFQALDDASMIFSGKLDLTAAANPAFSVYTYNITNGTNKNINEFDVMVREANTENWTSVLHSTVDDICKGDTSVWREAKVSLRDYKGKIIQVGVQGRCKGYAWFMVDNMKLADELSYNLSVSDIDAPKTAKPNVDFTIQARVNNLGAYSVSDYSVEFYRGASTTPFKTVKGTAIAAGSSRIFSTTDKFGFTDNDAEAEYHAVVKYAADENPGDDVSSSVKVKRQYSEKGAPTTLAGTISGGNANLTWKAPDVSGTGGNVVDDCESYTSWGNTAGNWIFIDKDLRNRGGFQDLEVPENPQNSKGTFFVFEQGGAFNESFKAHSGNKFFASLYNSDGSKVDDWLISPILDGSAQTIKFWAKSYSSTYPEVMEILYSTTDANTGSFKSLQVVDNVPGDWTEYKVALPEGTKFFAVRNNGDDRFMLMLDDFTFKAGLDEPAGYNIYRDGAKVNAAPVADTKYADTNVSAGKHRYDVTAVYLNGEESAPATCDVEVSGVDILPEGVSIFAGKGYIQINCAENMPVAIYNVGGIEICNIPAAAPEIRVDVAEGVYMVRINRGFTKVMVK